MGNLPVGDFSTTLSGLASNKNFYFRIYGENSAGGFWVPELGTLTTGDFSFKPESIAGGEMILWLIPRTLMETETRRTSHLPEPLIYGRINRAT